MALLNNHAGLNISNSKLQLVEVKFDNKQTFLENVEEVYFQEEVSKSSKETNFVDVLQTALNEISFKININSKKLSFSLSSDFFRFFEFPFDPTLKKNDFDDHLNWEFSKIFPHLDVSEYFLRHIKTASNRIFGLGLKRSLPKALHKFCLRNNFHLNKIDYSHLASNNLIHKLTGNDKTATLSIEQSSISLIARNNETVEYAVIRHYNSSSQIISIVSDILSHANSRGIDLTNFKPVYLTGSAVQKEIIENLKSSVNIEITSFNPFDHLSLTPNLKEKELVISNYYGFIAPTGIALRID